MCGRYLHYSDKQEIENHFDLQSDKDELFLENLNVCPGSVNPVILQPKPNRIGIGSLKWGLVPDWADSPQVAYKMINARTETIFEKKSFEKSILYHRCLIPANGFYEWKQLSEKQKQAYYIYHPAYKLISFAGIYALWKNPKMNTLLWTFAILTASSKGKMADLHERTPIVIPKKDYAAWLNPLQNDSYQIESFFQTELSMELEYKPISKKVSDLELSDLKLTQIIESKS